MFAANQKYLMDKFSVWYPIPRKLEIRMHEESVEGIPDNSFIGGGNFPKKIRSYIRSGNFDAAEKELAAFLSELAEKDSAVTLLSSEALLGTFGFNRRNTDLLSSVSNKYFKSTEIICVVRPPLDHTVSQYSEFVKRRRLSGSFDDACLDVFFDLGAYMEPFFASFGQSNVNIIPYMDVRQGESLVDRFLSAIDSRLTINSLPIEKYDSNLIVNRSMSVLECEAAATLNLMRAKFNLNRTVFVKAYTRYMSKHQKDSLVKFHYLSTKSYVSLLDISNSSFSRLASLCGNSFPFSSPGLVESMLNASQQRDVACAAKFNEIISKMLDEILAS